MKYGLIIDLRGIQDYIFSSNQLKDNVGASHLISSFFDDYKERPGFCGGGNLFLLCDEEKEAQTIIRELSVKTVEKSPGLYFNACYLKGFDDNNFKEKYAELQKMLQAEKNKRLQQTSVPAHGITAQCSVTNLSAIAHIPEGNSELEKYLAGKEEDKEPRGEYISEVVLAKLKAYFDYKEISQTFWAETLGADFQFPDEFGNLGRDEDNESFISVVHIDGNSIGKLFLKAESLAQMQELSSLIDYAFEQSMKDAIVFAKDSILTDKWKGYKDRLKTEKDVMDLPIRPLFIGGDDLTFVCEGRLGIPLAQNIMESIQKYSEGKLSCCAGVAKANYKYPFYQIYRLANSLCRSAKNKRIGDKSNENYLDFHLISSSVSTSLSDVRKEFYTLADDRSLTERPYSLERLQTLQNATKKMYKKWPNSKIKELRSILYQGQESINAFISHIKTNSKYSLKFTGFEDYDKDLFFASKTIYLDMIELMEMMPMEAK